MSDNLRVGVVGAGAISQVAHLPVLRKLKGVTVAAVCDNDLAKARALSDRFQVADAFDDIEGMLEGVALDAVVICTPNHLHEGHALAALRAGLHVLVEKPIAINAAGAARVVKAAEKKDRVVMVGMNHRYRADVQTVRSFVQTGELGEVESVRGSWHVFRPGRAMLGWRLKRDLAGGGAMLDLGLSILDLGLWLSGNPKPVRVSATLDRPGREKAIEHAGSAFVVCEGGECIFVDVTWHHLGEGERFGVGLRGSKGTASISPLKVWKEMHGTPQDVAPTGSTSRENAFTSSYRAEWAHFLAAIRGEAKAPPLDEHIALHKIMDAIYRSADDGREVLL